MSAPPDSHQDSTGSISPQASHPPTQTSLPRRRRFSHQKERSAAYLRGLALLVSAASPAAATAPSSACSRPDPAQLPNSASHLWSAPRLSALAAALGGHCDGSRLRPRGPTAGAGVSRSPATPLHGADRPSWIIGAILVFQFRGSSYQLRGSRQHRPDRRGVPTPARGQTFGSRWTSTPPGRWS